ncbi:MAG: metal-dependent hydrolase [Dehalococcoidales bacterium]|nr:metal-dependent hydrolase [Dehalococcoidales bacterium]
MKDTVTLAYFGGAAFKVTTATDKKIVIDPYITQNKLCQRPLDYFYDADLIVVSHGAADHLGDTVELMNKSQATLICGAEVARYCQKMGIAKERMILTIYGDQRDFHGIQVKTVGAQHISVISTDKEMFYGMPLGFIITTENGIRIYHTGDTSLFGDMKLIGMLYRPNVLLIGISRAAEGLPAEMNPSEAALATLWVAPDVAIPMHYPPGSDEPAKFGEAVKIMAPNVSPVVLAPNHQLTYSKSQFHTL